MLEQVFSKYSKYRESGLDSPWITHPDIYSKIVNLSKNENVLVSEIGGSIEGRSIFRIKIGHGKIKALLWSQMHGNESTATKAIFDLINFLTNNDEYTDLKNNILNSIEIHFIPMLNPDGAEKFTRENAINIDLNRDALSFQAPESIVLQKIKDEIKPDFCFNLHDQNRYYSVGMTGFSPALSFLAPPSGYNAPVNNARQKAMQIIIHLKNILEKYTPNQIARYSDDHEPRSFGDNFTRQETSVILVESGYLKNDPNKEKIRGYNFISLLAAFETISTGSYIKNCIADYMKIAENNEGKYYDLLLKGAVILKGGKEYKIDIGIDRREFPARTTKAIFTKGVIEGVGDLSTYSSHKVIDCKNLIACEGKILFNLIKNPDEINGLFQEQLMGNGFTTVLCKEYYSMEEYINNPFNIIQREYISSHEIKAGSPANLYLKNKTGVEYLIINGFLISSPFNINSVRNGLIFR